jgi:type II secretory pathway pseudopilin PulG
MLTLSLHPSPSLARQSGGAVLAVIAGLLVVAASTLAIRMARQVEEKTVQQQLTLQRMQRISQALQAYWLVHSCSLPGGAMGNAGTGDAGGGTTVPWRTLGIPREDALDAWGRKISYRSPASVAQYGAPAQPQTWGLVSHGPTGMGAWLADGQQMPLPLNVDELANASGGVLQLKTEAAGTDVLPANIFDDFLLWGSLDAADCTPPPMPPIVGAPSGISLTTTTLDSVAPISYSGRDTNLPSITIDPGPDVGLIDITAAGGNITRNGVPNGTAIGVCTTGCGNDNNSSLSGTESLSFKLQSKTAGKFALGVLSLDPTVELSITFRMNGSDLPLPGGQYLSPLVSTTPGVVKMFPDLMPSPPAPFDEVVVKPTGSSRFFIASIRFCAAAEVCD